MNGGLKPNETWNVCMQEEEDTRTGLKHMENERNSMTGTLYLVATPIGNLEDMTFRAVRVLKEVDLIAAEDTRGSIKLLNHFDIHTPMTSYHEYNRIEKAHKLAEKLREGSNIALITDAGTPGISDPGEDLVRICREENIPVTSLPGACAAVNGLIISGLPTRRFAFEAFLPSDKKERQDILEDLKKESRTIVLYEAPHRLVRTLTLLLENLGDRRITLCRELTKVHEEAFASTISGLLSRFESEQPRGECVLVIEGKSLQEQKDEQRRSWETLTIKEHMKLYEESGMDRKEAMKAVAKDRGIGKRDVYRELVEPE